MIRRGMVAFAVVERRAGRHSEEIGIREGCAVSTVSGGDFFTVHYSSNFKFLESQLSNSSKASDRPTVHARLKTYRYPRSVGGLRDNATLRSLNMYHLPSISTWAT